MHIGRWTGDGREMDGRWTGDGREITYLAADPILEVISMVIEASSRASTSLERSAPSISGDGSERSALSPCCVWTERSALSPCCVWTPSGQSSSRDGRVQYSATSAAAESREAERAPAYLG